MPPSARCGSSMRSAAAARVPAPGSPTRAAPRAVRRGHRTGLAAARTRVPRWSPCGRWGGRRRCGSSVDPHGRGGLPAAPWFRWGRRAQPACRAATPPPARARSRLRRSRSSRSLCPTGWWQEARRPSGVRGRTETAYRFRRGLPASGRARTRAVFWLALCAWTSCSRSACGDDTGGVMRCDAPVGPSPVLHLFV